MNIENLKYYILKVDLKDVVIGYCTQTKKKLQMCFLQLSNVEINCIHQIESVSCKLIYLV